MECRRKNVVDRAYNLGVKDGRTQVLKEICDILNDNEYPEYVEESIIEYLKDNGMKGDRLK